jgi:protein-disulfide isomerase/uncharacterized membrane protein
MKKAIIFTLTLFGLASSVYLFRRHIKLLREQIDNVTNICSTVFGSSCDATLQNANADFLGLPWAGWGIIYFSATLTFLLLQYFLKQDFNKVSNIALIGIAGIGSIISIILIRMMLMEKFPFCTYCLVIHLINIGLFGLILMHAKTSFKGFFVELGSGIAYLLTGQSKHPRLSKWQLIGFGFVAMLTLTVYQRITIEEQISPLFFSNAKPTKDLFKDFFEQDVIDIPITAEDATLGNVDAPVQMLVFSDFECPFCASFAEETKKWATEYPDKIRIIFKHYPLSSGCNPAMQDDMHPNACKAAVAAQAAHRQGKFWGFHDRLFQNDLTNVDYIGWANEMGLNVARFGKDLFDENISQKIKDDIELANKLEIGGTPSVIINGRKVADVQPQNIQMLINELLK